MNKKLLIVVGVIWSLVLISGVTYYQMKKSSEKINIIEVEKKNNVVIDNTKEESIVLYVFSEGKDKLVKKEEKVLYQFKTRDKIEKIAELVFENLWLNKVLNTAQIEIRNIYIKDDTIYLDVDANILELKTENRKNLLAIYSLVNSITEIGNIRKVKILVDGKEETGSFSKVYTRNTNI